MITTKNTICRGLVYPPVRILVTLRLLREVGYSRGKCEVVYRGGALINNRNKLSVYTRLVFVHAFSDLKRNARLAAL